VRDDEFIRIDQFLEQPGLVVGASGHAETGGAKVRVLGIESGARCGLFQAVSHDMQELCARFGSRDVVAGAAACPPHDAAVFVADDGDGARLAAVGLPGNIGSLDLI